MPTEKPREVKLPEAVTGRLWLHSMPGRYQPLDETLQDLARLGITTVVCLAPRGEIEEKSPGYARLLAAGPPWTHLDLPVPDYGVPRATTPFFQAAEAIAARLRSGQHVLLHCAAGVGRTGTFACVVLRALGLSSEQSTEVIEAAGSGPETRAQEALVQAYRGSGDAVTG